MGRRGVGARRVTGSASTKAYRCPGCDQEIRPGDPARRGLAGGDRPRAGGPPALAHRLLVGARPSPPPAAASLVRWRPGWSRRRPGWSTTAGRRTCSPCCCSWRSPRRRSSSGSCCPGETALVLGGALCATGVFPLAAFLPAAVLARHRRRLGRATRSAGATARGSARRGSGGGIGDDRYAAGRVVLRAARRQGGVPGAVAGAAARPRPGARRPQRAAVPHVPAVERARRPGLGRRRGGARLRVRALAVVARDRAEVLGDRGADRARASARPALRCGAGRARPEAASAAEPVAESEQEPA